MLHCFISWSFCHCWISFKAIGLCSNGNCLLCGHDDYLAVWYRCDRIMLYRISGAALCTLINFFFIWHRTLSAKMFFQYLYLNVHSFFSVFSLIWNVASVAYSFKTRQPLSVFGENHQQNTRYNSLSCVPRQLLPPFALLRTCYQLFGIILTSNTENRLSIGNRRKTGLPGHDYFSDTNFWAPSLAPTLEFDTGT